MLHLTFAAGLRVSELVTLRMDQLDQQAVTTIHVMGKGRRERVLPLWKETATAIKRWLAVRDQNGDPELFHKGLIPLSQATVTTGRADATRVPKAP